VERQSPIGVATGCAMGIPVVNTGIVKVRSGVPKTGETLLSVRALSACYRTQTRQLVAVSDLSFDVAQGEIVGVLGESGCGKTTVALSILRLLPDNAKVISGSVLFQGKDLLLLAESQLRNIRGAEAAIIHQDASVLNPLIRVGDQVSQVLRAHQRCSRIEARERVQELFSSIGLLECERLYEAYPHQLSGGQRQRIGIAQALVCKPRLVIADEPTASLDQRTNIEILSLIRQLRESCGTSFLVISHDPDALAAIADRIIVMYAGQIVEEGPVVDVYSQPLHPYTRALLQCAPTQVPVTEIGDDTPRLPFIPGSPPDPLDPMPGCSFSCRCADRMQVCDLQKPDQILASPSRLVRCFKYEDRSHV